MNADVKFAMQTKAKYGVTFTRHMSLKDIVEAWGRVSPEIKQQSGTVGDMITTLSAILTAQEALRSTTVATKEAYALVQSAIELASVPAGGTQVAPLAAAVGAKQGESILNQQIEDAPQTILAKLSEQV